MTNEIIGGMSDNIVWGWVFFTAVSTALAFIAATLVVNVAPEAVGPGVTELMSYLNGVNNSSWFGFRIFWCKVAGIVLAGVSGLCVGNIGTFAHIGALIGMGVLYLPIKNIDYYHLDSRKREFVAAGLSCGMAVAFGAPIGGTLFGYEISQPNTYWQFNSMWRVFLCCTIGVVVNSFWTDLWFVRSDYGWILNSSPMRFGTITFSFPSIESLPTSIVIGAICGLVSACWVASNSYVQMFRRAYIVSPNLQILEVMALALITSSFFFWLPYWTYAECFAIEGVFKMVDLNPVQYNCPAGFFNPLATLMLNTEGLTLRAITGAYQLEIQGLQVLSSLLISVFALCWFYFSVLTQGSSVPTGVFMSGILIGCSIGFLFEIARISIGV